MLRALVTMLVMSLLVVLLGVPVLLLGLIYPFRWVMARGGQLWSLAILRAAGVRLAIEGREHLRGGAAMFFMGNHESALDIPVLIVGLRGNVRFFGKDALFRIPVFGWVLHRYGYIPIHRSNPRATLRKLERMLARIKRRPISLAVFPEGTRRRGDQLLPFRMGTMKIGQRAGLPIVPFSIDGSMAVIHRDEFRAVPGPVRLTFSEPIPALDAAAMSPSELHDRVRGAVLRGLGRAPEDPAPSDDAPMMAAEGT
jgi:1-acyl-sn-glycerol-3-phosphate acyltransferase